MSGLVEGRRVLVTIADDRAAATVTDLIERGAQVVVHAEVACAAIEDLADRGLVSWQVGTPTVDDLLAAEVVVNTAAVSAAAMTRTAVRGESGSGRGEVIIVGGGPGAPGLLTVAGSDALAGADVVVVDRLAPLSALTSLGPEVEVIDVAKVPGGRQTPQEQINALLVQRAQAGQRVVRLKGGDGFVFGRGGEEVEACLAADVAVRVIPGVSSSVAGPALAGIPVTHRGVTQGFTVVSGHVPPGDRDSTVNWDALARTGTTIVVLMGLRNLADIAAALVQAGCSPTLPAAVIADAGLPSQQVVAGDLLGIADQTKTAGLLPPAVIVIGEVAALGWSAALS